MDNKTLELFTQQLCLCAGEVISLGRSPFRKAEAFAPLLTSRGPLTPSLVFWINRDSWMAGGLLLVLQERCEDDLELGRACAEALGLKHFVTWEREEVVFWECRKDACVRHRSLSLSVADREHSAGFKSTLVRLLDELKILSVTGMVTPGELSPFCLCNLFRAGLTSVEPSLLQAYRIARAEQPLPYAQPGIMARTKALLSLVRLLTLVSHDLLSPSVQPEGLERAMFYAMDALPAAFGSMAPEPDEMPLPVPAAIGFHHLFRRLNQLGFRQAREKAAKALEVLLEQEFPSLHQTSSLWPEADTANAPVLFVNVGRPKSAGHSVSEVAPTPILAYHALLRNLLNQPPAKEQRNSPFLLDPDSSWKWVCATLLNPAVPETGQRKILAAHLRTSWPSRRFSLSTQTPQWAWELFHLAGLAGDQARLDLHVPSDWLAASWGEKVFDLLREAFTIDHMSLAPAGPMRLGLQKTAPNADAGTFFHCGDIQRQRSWEQLEERPRSYWNLALKAPDSLLDPIEKGLLTFPDPDLWPEQHEREIYLFTRSAMGRILWDIVSQGQPLPRRANLRADLLRFSMPVPTPEILEHLAHISWEPGSSLPEKAINSEIDQWVASAGHPVPAARSGRKKEPAKTSAPSVDLSALAEEIRREVFIDGVPKFPEHYLYNHYKPRLREYTFKGPLQLVSNFFDTFTLVQPDGTTLEIEGEETARALLLTSHSSISTVSLPEDRHLTLEILNRYQTDLSRLRQELIRRANAQVEDSKQATELAEGIWRGHPLPPWELLAEMDD